MDAAVYGFKYIHQYQHCVCAPGDWIDAGAKQAPTFHALPLLQEGYSVHDQACGGIYPP